MSNLILDQLGSRIPTNEYEYGEVVELKGNDIFIITTLDGFSVPIKETTLKLEVGDPVLLGVENGKMSSAFIIKKGSKKHPTIVNFIVGNGVD